MNTKKQIPAILDRESLEHVTEWVKYLAELSDNMSDNSDDCTERKMLNDALIGLQHVADCLRELDES